jgi:hypothetical protein
MPGRFAGGVLVGRLPTGIQLLPACRETESPRLAADFRHSDCRKTNPREGGLGLRNLIDKEKVKNVVKWYLDDVPSERIEFLSQEIITSADPIVYLLIRKKIIEDRAKASSRN